MSKNGLRSLIWINFSGATVDHLIKNTLIIFVGFQAQSEQQAAQFTAIALALFMLPCILLSGVAGQLGDNNQKLPLFKKLKTIEYTTIGFICYGLYINNIYLLCLLLLPIGIIACLTGPLKLAMIDESVNKQQRSQSSTLFQLSTIIAILIGTALGGGLLNTGLNVAIIGIMLCTLINAIGVYRQKSLLKPQTKPRAIIRFGDQYKRMYQAITHDPKLVLACLMITYYWFVINLSYSQITTLAKYQLNIDESNTSLIFIVMTVSIACGSILFLLLKSRLSQGKLILLGGIGFTLGYGTLSQIILLTEGALLFGLLNTFNQVLIVIFISNLFSSQLLFLGYALLQVNGADTQKTTIFAASNVISASGMIASAIFISMALHYHVNIHQLFFIYSLLSLCGGLCLWQRYYQHAKLTHQSII